MKRLLLGFGILLCVAEVYAQGYNASAVRLSEEEMELYELVMAYRAEKGLPRIAISPALTYVAQVHARDVYDYYGEIPAGCNSHSWSSHGPWTRCDYYPDHRNASGMWNKPRELTDYHGNGYEIAHYYTPPSSGTCTPEGSLRGWQNSPGHNAVMVNLNNWSSITWRAIGLGMYKGVAVIWFGEGNDPHTMSVLPIVKTPEEKEAEKRAQEARRMEEERKNSPTYVQKKPVSTEEKEAEERAQEARRIEEERKNSPTYVQKPPISTEEKPESVVVVVKQSEPSTPVRKTAKRTTEHALLSRYYGHSGKVSVGWIGAGYTYSCRSREHLVSAELLNLRAGLFGLSLLDFEMGVAPNISPWFAYRPSAKFYIPTCKWLSVCLYGGAETDITYLGQYFLPDYTWNKEDNYFLNAFGGLGLHLTGLRWMPIDLNVEYRHPIINTIQPQGVYLSAKLYLATTWKRS